MRAAAPSTTTQIKSNNRNNLNRRRVRRTRTVRGSASGNVSGKENAKETVRESAQTSGVGRGAMTARGAAVAITTMVAAGKTTTDGLQRRALPRRGIEIIGRMIITQSRCSQRITPATTTTTTRGRIRAATRMRCKGATRVTAQT